MLLFPGCGYRPIGRPEPGTVPIATIAVPTWENRTAFRGLEAVFTEKVIEAIAQRGLARVVAPADAEATLQGRIISISESAASYSPPAAEPAPADYRVVVLANITVTRKSDQKVLWQLSLQEETYYDARDRALMLDSNRRDALARAAEGIARQVVGRWGGGF